MRRVMDYRERHCGNHQGSFSLTFADIFSRDVIPIKQFSQTDFNDILNLVQDGLVSSHRVWLRQRHTAVAMQLCNNTIHKSWRLHNGRNRLCNSKTLPFLYPSLARSLRPEWYGQNR